jgi:ubiquinone/menaquinone biosynthesis C-methylase UbiE
MALDHFSLLAPFYDHFFGRQDLTLLHSLLALPVAGRLLDAGGGTGRVSQTLQEQAGQIVITDESGAMLRQAAPKNGLMPLLSPAERLPFPNASFDRVLVVDAFHHFAHQQQTIAEFWRVLTPGGRLVIEEPNIETWPVKLIALGEKLALMRSHFFTAAKINDA